MPKKTMQSIWDILQLDNLFRLIILEFMEEVQSGDELETRSIRPGQEQCLLTSSELLTWFGYFGIARPLQMYVMTVRRAVQESVPPVYH
jgi:hypothetical protein